MLVAGPDHLQPIIEGRSERLLAEDMLTGAGCLENQFLMGIGTGGDIHDIAFNFGKKSPEISIGCADSVLGHEGAIVLGVAIAHSDQLDLWDIPPA
jgi:hypothetical protein